MTDHDLQDEGSGDDACDLQAFGALVGSRGFRESTCAGAYSVGAVALEGIVYGMPTRVWSDDHRMHFSTLQRPDPDDVEG